MPKGGRRARAGRPRKPTDLKIIQGTFRADRHGDEIQTPVGDRKESRWPRPPKWLSDRERKYWRELRKFCEPWTEPSDWPAIAGIVALVDLFVRSREDESAVGGRSVMTNKIITSLPGPKGGPVATQTRVEVKESPFRTQQIRILKELRAYAGLQGLSAVDRARMRTSEGGDGKEKPESPLAGLIRRSRS